MATARNYPDNCDIQYKQIQRESKESFVSLTSGSFPAHIRSVKPHEVQVALERAVPKATTWRSTHSVYVILALIFVVTSSVAIAFAVQKIRLIKSNTGDIKFTVPTNTASVLLPNSTEQQQGLSQEVPPTSSSVPDEKTKPPGPSDADSRTPCVTQCTVYRDSKFGATCDNGYCTCSGEDYQRETCLPDVEGCRIIRSPRSNAMEIWGTPTALYSCPNVTSSSNMTSPSLKVISVYGNQYSPMTRVLVTCATRRPLTLVVASHFPVRWNISRKLCDIIRVIMLSEDKMPFGDILIDQESVSMSNIVQPVGYGDDRHHSNTAEMLRKLTSTYGAIESFTGAAFADVIRVSL